MLITTTIQKPETVTKEIQLPYYSKKHNTYYRINEDESVLQIYVVADYGSMQLIKKGGIINYLSETLNGEVISEKEFETKLQEAVEYMDTILSSLSKVAV